MDYHRCHVGDLPQSHDLHGCFLIAVENEVLSEVESRIPNPKEQNQTLSLIWANATIEFISNHEGYMESSPSLPERFLAEHGHIEGAVQDKQSITADWVFPRQLIDGVRVKEIKSVPGEKRILTEVYRADWALDGKGVGQVFQVQLLPGAITAWHVHQFTTDRLFVSAGLLKIVLYDARQGSPTFGQVNEFRFGTARPGVISVPPGVWHGVHNITQDVACLINVVDRPYQYESPDHWRLPWNTDRIPYSFVR